MPVVIPRSEHPISRSWISPNALRVLYRLRERGHVAYLVGGGVRDLLLGREPKDFDIATDASPNEVKKVFRNCRLIGRRFRLAHIHFPNEIIEVATFRSNITEEHAGAEIPPEATIEAKAGKDPAATPAVKAEAVAPAGPGAVGAAGAEAAASPEAEQRSLRPERPRPPRMLKSEDGMILRDNVFGTPEQDAIRRDFTVNALFYNIADFSVIDYVGGMADLKAGLIRLIGDPVVRFIEDPVRMVRAVRFAAMLGFEIEEQTLKALLELRDKVALASSARMYEEVQKLFLLGEGEKVFQLLRKTGIFGVLFPHINAWLDQEEEHYPHIRVGKALEWVDSRAAAGKKPEPHLLFSLMFGQYIGEKWERQRGSGGTPLEALDRAVAEFLAEIVPRVQVPKKVALGVRDILWNQGRFEKRQGKAPLYFLRRPGFAEAFEYLRFVNETTGEQNEVVAWWADLVDREGVRPAPPRQAVTVLAAQQPAGTRHHRPSSDRPAAAEGTPERTGRKRRRRRPRRRGPRPEAPKT